MLDAVSELAADLDVGIRTRAIVGRDADDVVPDAVEEEAADHVLLGWQGHRSRREHVLGSTIDPVVENAPCDTTLVKHGADATEGGNVLALAGEGSHAPVAARRAADSLSRRGPTNTLLNVQTPADGGDPDGPDPTTAGRQVIEEVAEAAGLERGTYEAAVVVSEKVEATVLERASVFDTVCVGATRVGTVEQALFGSLPEAIGQQFDGTVAMARGAEGSPHSTREAPVERLTE